MFISRNIFKKFLTYTTLGIFSGNIFVVDISNSYADDTTSPVISLSGEAILDVPQGIDFIDPGALWTDDTDGSGSVLAYSGSVDSTTLGTYTLEYIYIDVAGNSSNLLSRTVNVLDLTPPVITLSGSNPLDILQNSQFIDPGATCVDNIDANCVTSYSGFVDTSNLGTYIIDYSATDGAGNSGSLTRTVNILANSGSALPDITPPLVTLRGSTNALVEAQTGSYVDLGASWTDTVDGSGDTLDATFTLSGTVDLLTPGFYSLTYTKTDSSNNTGSVTRTIMVVDTTAPTLTLLGTNPLSLIQGDIFSDSGALWEDIVDGIGMLTTASSGTVDTSTVGTYTLTYEYRDTSNNTGSITRTVNILANSGSALPDITPPLVTLRGSTNALVEAQTGSYVDLGASWTDTVDGSGDTLDATFTLSGTVDLLTPGFYSLTYTKTDSSNNTGSVTRTIMVVDTTAPTLTLLGTNPLSLIQGDIFSDSGALWEDIVDGIGMLTTASSGTVDTSTVGTYTLTYEYRDTSNNTGSITRTVNILANSGSALPDITPPLVTLRGSTNALVEAQTGSYVDLGASWTDTVDGSGDTLDATFTLSGTVDLLTPGFYSLTYTKTDSSNNTGSVTRTIMVVDTTAPTLTLLGTNPLSLIQGDIFSDSGALWEDIVDGIGMLTTASSGTVDTSTVGTYTLTYEYRDTSNNTGSITRTVNILANSGSALPDITPPLVTLRGSTNALVEAQTGSYVDLGASWTDTVDGSGDTLDATFTLSGTVDLLTPGFYSLTYTKTDSSNNTGSVTRTIMVVDTTAPTLTLLGTNPLSLIQGDIFSDSGALWEDIVDGIGMLTTASSGTVDTSTVGTYTLTYEYRDTSNNTGSITRTVNILANSGSALPDITPPLVTLRGSTNALVEAQTGSYVDLGASWTDTVDGSGDTLDATFTLSGTVDLLTPGLYSLTYTKTDSSNNTGSVTRTIMVVDTTAPTISLNGLNEINIPIGSIYTDSGARWYDLHLSGSLVGSGIVDTSTVGINLLSYAITDSSGNTRTIVRRVIVYSVSLPVPTPRIGGGGAGSSPASSTFISKPLPGLLFAEYFLRNNLENVYIDSSLGSIDTGVMTNHTKKPIRTPLFSSKGLYSLIEDSSLYYTKKMGKQYIIQYINKNEQVKVRYITENGWALITTKSGTWGFIESSVLKKN